MDETRSRPGRSDAAATPASALGAGDSSPLAELSMAHLGRIYSHSLSLCMTAGVLIFLVGFYLLPHVSAMKVVFYLLILAPWLLLSPCLFRRAAILSHPIVMSSMALSLYLATSSFWGANPGLATALDAYKQVIFILAWLSACIWIAGSYPSFYRALPKVIVWTGAATAVATTIIYLATAAPDFPRMPGLGANSNPLIAASSFGVVGVMAFTMGRQQYPDSPLNHYFWIALLALLAMALTQSRAPLAFYGASLALVLCLYPLDRRQVLFKAGAIALILVTSLILYPRSMELLWERGTSWSHRDEIWLHMFQRFLAAPIQGEGFQQDPGVMLPSGFYTEHSHNSWLATLRFGGLLGLGLALWHLATCFRGWRLNRDYIPVYLWLFFGCLSALTTGGLFLAKPGWMWLFYWMPVGLIAGRTSAALCTAGDPETPGGTGRQGQDSRSLASS